MLYITDIKPTFNHILTTADTFEKDQYNNGIIVAKKGDLKLWQTVVHAGPMVREVKEGDKVMIIPDHFAVKKYNKNSVQNDLDNNPVLSYHFPIESIVDDKGEAKDYLYLSDADIRYVFEGYEKDEVIITPSNPKIIL